MLTRTIIESLLIIGGESFMLFAGVAQVLRLIKTRDTAGLSAVTYALYAAGNVAWIMYFVSLELWIPVATNAANLVLTTAALGYVLSNRKQFVRGLWAVAVLGPITGYVLVVHPNAAGWIGALYNVIAATPGLLRVVRRKKVTGLSQRALFLGTGAFTMILIYGVLVGANALVISCTQGLIYEFIILRYYYRYRRAG